MRNPLRIVNEKYKDFDVFSIKGLFLIIAITGFGYLYANIFNIDLIIIVIVYISLSVLLMVDNYFRLKKEVLEDEKK